MVMFVLGGAQGVLGWFMVKSGLVDRPDVSQYRLTAHLGLVTLIYAYIFNALGLLAQNTPKVNRRALSITGVSVFWVFLTMLAGGFVAGLDAGLTYNTFPLMDGKFIPDGLLSMSPVFRNFFENVTAVQFGHRMMAYGSIILVSITFWQGEGPRSLWAANNAFLFVRHSDGRPGFAGGYYLALGCAYFTWRSSSANRIFALDGRPLVSSQR